MKAELRRGTQMRGTQMRGTQMRGAQMRARKCVDEPLMAELKRTAWMRSEIEKERYSSPKGFAIGVMGVITGMALMDFCTFIHEDYRRLKMWQAA